jgi:hypothetical protein
MDGFRNLRDSFIEAAALGLLATATLYVAPLQVAQFLDRWLFDIWSQLSPAAAPPDDILVVRLDEPTAIDAVAAVAREARARLLISTERQAPAAQDDDFTLGPMELPAGPMRLERTEWRNGGRLLFEPDIDGVIRNDVPFADEGTQAPSLALRAAEKLRGLHAVDAAREYRGADGRRWLHFYSERSFPEVTAEEALADPRRLRDKVIIAGGSERNELTPLGPLSTNMLLAHALSGYLQDLRIDAGTSGIAIAWCSREPRSGSSSRARPRSAPRISGCRSPARSRGSCSRAACSRFGCRELRG